MTALAPKTCSLRLAADGVLEPCPREACPFWETGGAVVPGGCLFDRLALDIRRPALAARLLETRRSLEAERDAGQRAAGYRELVRRIRLEL
jgi:hypothetical protein